MDTYVSLDIWGVCCAWAGKCVTYEDNYEKARHGIDYKLSCAADRRSLSGHIR